MSEYKTVSGIAESVTVIERSKFICLVSGVNSEEEAKNFIASTRKKYPQANHYCYAFVLGENGFNQKFSDDGEPHGTAGMPILTAIKGRGLINVVAVVVRYFGGIKLGTGGLSRAYGGAAAETLDKSDTVFLTDAEFFTLTLTYGQYKKISNLLSGIVVSTEYGGEVKVTVAVKTENGENVSFISKISEILGNEYDIISDGKGLFEFK